jgi:hypothetical protein
MQSRHPPAVLLSISLIVAISLALIPSATFQAQESATPVFINEIHYDNDGADLNEAVEIAGPAGTDLSGWNITLYNGNGGAVYGTINLTGVIPDQMDGYGTLYFPRAGIQNGAPDGLALVDGDSNVIQFLSYEGTFTAVGGPADGLSSTDIGVSESSSTPADNSLRLTGEGSAYEDFTWKTPAINTFGDINSDQIFSSPPTPTPTPTPIITLTPTSTPTPEPPPNVYISEIRIDQPSTDNDEYFELSGDPGASLDGVTYLVIGDGTGGSGVIEAVVDLTGSAISGSGFFVAAESTFTLGTADLTANLNFENSDNVTHLLVFNFSGANGDDLDTDDDGVLDVTPWETIIDLIALVEEENPPSGTEYHYGPPSIGPDGSYVPGHVFTCTSVWTIGAYDPLDGDDTPGASNMCAVPPPAVLISEIRIDQPSTDNDEYFELAGAPGASLDGVTYLVIGDGTGGSGVIEAVVDLTGSAISGSGFFVAAESTFTLGTADLTANLNFENSDNVTHLLVFNFSGANGDDLDTDDDGVLDITPWETIIDLIALVEEENPPSGTEYHYGPPSIGPDGSYVPGHVFTCTSVWTVGEYDPLEGDDTPGASNMCVVPPPDVLISEIRIDQPGTDNDEYFELAGDPGTSLDGVTYLVIGDGTGGSGVIENVTDLAGYTIPTSGFFVAAESTFTLGTADLTTSLSFENGDNVTHLLVSDFSGANGDDLDTNDDGVLDVTPWETIIDLIALIEEENPPSYTEYHYGPPTIGPDG